MKKFNFSDPENPVTIEDLEGIQADEALKHQLVISAQNKAENVGGKVEQREANLNDAQNRQEDAKFSLGKAWGQAALTTVGLSSHYVSQKYQRHVKPVMEGINQVFGAITQIAGSQRALDLANRQLAKLAGTSNHDRGDNQNPSSQKITDSNVTGFHIPREPSMLQRMWRNAHDRTAERTTTRITKVGLLAGGPSGGAASGPV